MWPHRVCTIATLAVGEIVDRAHQEIGLRDEVGVENRDELALRDPHAFVERAGLVSMCGRSGGCR